MIDIKKQLGQKTKELHLKANILQGKLAMKAKIHITYISDIEHGERKASVDNIKKIAKVLKVKPNELLKF